MRRTAAAAESPRQNSPWTALGLYSEAGHHGRRQNREWVQGCRGEATRRLGGGNSSGEGKSIKGRNSWKTGRPFFLALLSLGSSSFYSPFYFPFSAPFLFLITFGFPIEVRTELRTAWLREKKDSGLTLERFLKRLMKSSDREEGRSVWLVA